MEANQLPTKPGPYYWRESDGDKWARVFNVRLSNSIGLCVDEGFYHESVEHRGGQWLPIPTAEELLELLWRVHNVLDDPSPIMLRHLGKYVSKLRKEMGE
jgi:hypothetical protein